jgi:hypothetical protein
MCISLFFSSTRNEAYTFFIICFDRLSPQGIFVVMSIFACSYFFKWDRVQSRSLLGFGAVICVLLSIITSFGLLFIIGTCCSSVNQGGAILYYVFALLLTKYGCFTI